MSALTRLVRQPWFWAYVAAGLTFLPTAMLSQGVGGGWDLFAAALTFAAFSVLVGLGQMLVITMGPGNVDLSIPATMTLAGTLSLKLMDGAAGTEAAGLAAALGVGVACGAANWLLICCCASRRSSPRWRRRSCSSRWRSGRTAASGSSRRPRWPASPPTPRSASRTSRWSPSPRRCCSG